MKPHISAHIEPLTALRGIAACFVLLFHYRTHFPALTDATAFASRGYVWVDLFFALSGYIMATMYHGRLAGGYRSPAMTRYFWARVARIYPLHLVTLAVMIGMEAAYALAQQTGIMAADNPAFASAERNAFAILTNVLLIQAWGVHPVATWNGPAWSISCEWAMYLLLPLLMPVLLRWNRKAQGIMLAVCMAGYGWLEWVHPSGTLDIAVGLSVVRALFGFSAGIVLYAFFPPHHGAPIARDSLWFGLCLLAAGLMALSPMPDAVTVPLFWVMLVLAGRATPGSALHRALSCRPLMALGLWSYSIYLWHIPLLLAVQNASRILLGRKVGEGLDGAEAGLVTAALIAAAIALSWASYRLIELPAQRFILRRFGKAGRD